MSNYIITNGCSYTYGIGLDKNHGTPVMHDNRWSSLLANSLSMADVNLSSPGACNQRIARTTLMHCSRVSEKPKLAIIMWSDPPRTEIFRPQENEYSWQDLAQINPQSIGKIKDRLHKESFEMYFSFIHSRERALIHTLYNMMSTQLYFDSINVPVINFHYKPNFFTSINRIKEDLEKLKTEDKYIGSFFKTLEEYLDYFSTKQHTFGFKDDTSFLSLIENEGDMSPFSGGHPYIESHKIMSLWFEKYIVENNVIS